MSKDSLFLMPISHAAALILHLSPECTSDEKGKFVISKLEADNYLLQISFVGYITQVIRLDNLSRPLDIGTIQLADEAIMLQGVTVKASNVMKR